MDSRNRRLQRDIQTAPHSLEARVAFVTAGIRSGLIPVNLVQRASMIGNETAVVIFPEVANAIRTPHVISSVISDYFFEEAQREDPEVGILIQWSADRILEKIKKHRLKIGKRSALAQILQMAKKGLYPDRVEDYESLERLLSEEIEHAGDVYDDLAFEDRPPGENNTSRLLEERRASRLYQILLAGESLLRFLGCNIYGERVFRRTTSSLHSMISWIKQEGDPAPLVRDLCDALMRLPRGR